MSDIVEHLRKHITAQEWPTLQDRAADEITRLREENARLRAENRHTITKKIVLEWYPELDKQTGCYDYRVAMNSMGQAFDVFRQLVLYPALDENVLLREENARLREVLKPFVKTLELNCTEAYPDDFFIDQEGALRVSDLRAARAAIREGGKDEN